ncbi:fibrillin-1-like [Ptychodera flava]|uniref:fibrillin-1-like n=1 Tax=Ptychodera flava TaxID=63121 RepID=UPI00396A876E
MNILIDGQPYNTSSLSYELTEEGLENVKLKLKRVGNSTTDRIIASFSTGVSISVGVVGEDNLKMLDVVFSAPESFKDKTVGLLGVWNDDISDDFTMPNGNVKQSAVPGGNLTEREQFEFGQTWMVFQNDSLFTYPNGRTWQDYNDLDFVPFFLDELIASFEANDTDFLNTARGICQDDDDCLFDTLATKATAIGETTKQASTGFKIEAEKLTNFPPSLNGSQIIQAEVNKMFTLQVTASDPNNDEVTFRLAKDVAGATINATTGEFTWTPQNTDFVEIEIEASDGKALSLLKPTVQICECLNGGTCNYDANVAGSDEVNNKFKNVTCDCPPGWTGDSCEKDFDACLDHPCYHGVNCTDNKAPDSGFVCAACPPGLSGDGVKCFDIDECYEEKDGKPDEPFCEQVCNNTEGSYDCGCFNGYEKVDGSRTACRDIDECSRNDFDCHDNSYCNNTEGSYECVCNDGYKERGNSTCTNINECLEEADVCPRQSECKDTVGSFSCECLNGFEKSGEDCEDIDECSVTNSNDCHGMATCVNVPGTYTCDCNDGWHGNGTTCEDINECEDINLNNCDPQRGVCTNSAGTFSCECKDGYVGSGTSGGCQNVDECTTSTHTCPARSRCEDTIGSYRCVCLGGYLDMNGDGRNCTDVDECALNITTCPPRSHCVNTVGASKCECNEGYLENSNGICQDIDECLSAEHDCDTSISRCVNNEGSFICQCKLGYTGDGQTCTDINECEISNGGCHQLCNNTDGGHFCSCSEGYNLATDGLNCLDNDECEAGTHDCPQNCSNVDRNTNSNGFKCVCFNGFDDDTGDGRTCTPEVSCTGDSCIHGTCYVLNNVENCQCDQGYVLDVSNSSLCNPLNECDTGSHSCQHVCHDQTPGYTCTCNDGYVLNSDERTCTDIDECIIGQHNCTVLQQCINEEGSFQCVCLAGFGSSSGDCQDVDECATDNPCHINGTCTNTIGYFKCECNEGFQGNGMICTDVNECERTSPCNEHADCINTIGGHQCQCRDGFTGNGVQCTDTNECETSDTSLRHRCNPTTQCQNTQGSYTCICPDGFLGNGLEECIDINECEGGTDGCDDSISECTNIKGSFLCICKDGFTMTDGSCVDVDECKQSPCTQNERCINLPGSYQCQCRSNYYRSHEDAHCEESTSFNASMVVLSVGVKDMTVFDTQLTLISSTVFDQVGGVIEDDVNTVFLNSSVGSDYLGSIVSGFEPAASATRVRYSVYVKKSSRMSTDDVMSAFNAGLTENGQLVGMKTRIQADSFNIQDLVINHCIDESDNCKANEKCVFQGHNLYTCTCSYGYEKPGNQELCTDVDECLSNPCQNNEQCVNRPGSYECVCLIGTVRVGDQCKDTVVFQNALTLTEEFKDAYNDKTSPEYTQFTTLFTAAISATFKTDQRTGNTYQVCVILDVKKGSTEVTYNTYFTEDIGSADIERVYEDLGNNLTVTDDITFYFVSNPTVEKIIPKACDVNDCSVNAECIDIHERFHCSCKDGYQDMSSRPGRVCTEICPSTYCSNGGTCVGETIADRTCDCPPEYSGDRCLNTSKPAAQDERAYETLAIGLGATAGALFIAVVIFTVYCCHAKISKSREHVKASSHWRDFTAEQDGKLADAWSADQSSYSDGSLDDFGESIWQVQARQVARSMENAPINEGIDSPIYQSSQMPETQFIRPYVAAGHEEQYIQRADTARHSMFRGQSRAPERFSELTRQYSWRQREHDIPVDDIFKMPRAKLN